jgi:hypothetical protein
MTAQEPLVLVIESFEFRICLGFGAWDLESPPSGRGE